MFDNKPIPEESRTKLLKPLLKEISRRIPEFNASIRRLSNYGHLFSYNLLIFDETNPLYDDERIKPYREALMEKGETGDFAKWYKDELRKILETDPHLKVCCDNHLLLSVLLDKYFLGQLINLRSLGLTLDDMQFDIMYEELVSIIYQCSYSRTGLFHLYNFDYKEKDLIFEDVEIHELEESFIPRLLGETTPFSILHYAKTGNYFVCFSDHESPNNFEVWLNEIYQKALDILALLRHFQDGVVDIDYYSIYFKPDWVNSIRKVGIYYNGNIRNTLTTPQYTLEQESIDLLCSYRKIQLQNLKRLKSADSQLGNVLQRAQRHYANYHSKDIKEEQFLELIIALESLYSPSDRAELTYRIRQYAGIFLDNQNEGIKIFDFLNKILQKRGQLVHGQYNISDVQQDVFLTSDEMNYLASIVRRSILGFIVLFLRGENSRDTIHTKLQNGLFKPIDIQTLREECNPEKYIEEFLQIKS